MRVRLFSPHDTLAMTLVKRMYLARGENSHDVSQCVHTDKEKKPMRNIKRDVFYTHTCV